jgi:hypothetical protein
VTEYEDGKRRQTATLTLLWEEQVWKCCVNDRDNNRSLWVSGDSISEVIERAEKALHDDSPAWRTYKPYKKR